MMSCTWFYVGRITEGDTGRGLGGRRENGRNPAPVGNSNDIYMYLPYKTDAFVGLQSWVNFLSNNKLWWFVRPS